MLELLSTPIAPTRPGPAPIDLPRAVGRREIRSLQLGMGWFPEQAGGLNRYFFHLLDALPKQDVSARGVVAASDDAQRRLPSVVRAFAPSSASLPLRWWRIRGAIRQELQQYRPEIVASHFALYSAPVVRCFRGLPHIVHFHGPWAMECALEGDRGLGNVVKQRIERSVYRSADACIVLSRAFRRILVEKYGVAPERIHVVPGGADIERFRPTISPVEARRHLDWPIDHPILLCVRRLVNRMGLNELIDAIDIVRRRHSDVLLFIAGRGPLHDRLAQQINELGLQRQVRLLGFLPDEKLPAAMRAADLTVVPSTALEGFGLTAVESLAAGTPPLVTMVGGLPEIVEHLEPSLLIERADAQSISTAITEALSGHRRLPSEAECIAFAAARYSWSGVAGAVRDVYLQMIGAHH